MSLTCPLVTTLTAELTAPPGGEGMPYTPPPPQPAVLVITLMGPQESDGNVPVAYTIDKNDPTVAAVLYLDGTGTPGAADFGGGGAPSYTDLGTVALDTSGTPIDLAFPDGLNGSYRLALLPTGGTDGNVAESAAVMISTLAAPGPQVSSTPTSVYASSLLTDTGGTGATFTAATGTNRLLLAMVSYINKLPPPTLVSLSMGTQPFTLVSTLGSGSNAIPKEQFFYIREADIPGGGQGISVAFDQPVSYPVVTLVEMTGVNQMTPIGATAVGATLDNETTTSIALTTTAANAMLITCFALTGTTDQAFSPETDSGGTLKQIIQHEQPGGYGQGTGCYETVPTSGTTVTHSCSWLPTSSRWGRRILEILAA